MTYFCIVCETEKGPFTVSGMGTVCKSCYQAYQAVQMSKAQKEMIEAVKEKKKSWESSL